MNVGLWSRWVAMHGVPRAFMKMRGRLGDPLGRVISGHGRAIDPYPLYDEIRGRGTLVRGPYVWVSADHVFCREVLRDRRFGVSSPTDIDLPAPLKRVVRRSDPGVPNPVEPPAMVIVNPPDHTRYRQLVAQSFTPRAVDAMASRVAEVTATLLDRLAEKPEPDLIADFAARLPVAIIADILDLPEDLHPRMLEWGRVGAPLLDIGIGWRTYRTAIDGLRDAGSALGARFSELRASGSGDSPFAKLAVDGSLTEREFTSNAALLIGAGFETTVNLIGNGIAILLDNPDQLARLHDDPSLWPSAVEEILRLHSPVQMTARSATCDAEIAGHHVPEGQMVALMLAGANRDPKVFDEPDRFDVTRPNSRDHLSFATGIHACLGAALARIEAATALRALFEHYPDLRVTTPPTWGGLTNLRGHPRLPAAMGSRNECAAAVSA